MRLLADENFPKPIVDALRAPGHDVLWARTELAGSKDIVLLDLAESEARIVLTLDKDFWQIAVQRRSPLERSGVVLFRVHPATPEKLGPLVRAFVEAPAVWAGHVSIVSADGIQMLATRKHWGGVSPKP
jgi:predicted nuclease of predicted toxin-antitoxin system